MGAGKIRILSSQCATVDTSTIQISKAFHTVVLHLLFPYGERDVRIDTVGCFFHSVTLFIANATTNLRSVLVKVTLSINIIAVSAV